MTQNKVHKFVLAWLRVVFLDNDYCKTNQQRQNRKGQETAGYFQMFKPTHYVLTINFLALLKVNQIFHYNRCITPKCVTSRWGPFPHHAPGQHSSFRRIIAAVASRWQYCERFDRSRDESVTTRPTDRLFKVLAFNLHIPGLLKHSTAAKCYFMSKNSKS